MYKVTQQERDLKQLATVRMLRSENKVMADGEASRVPLDEWSQWLDIEIDEVLELQDYIDSFTGYDLYNSALSSCELSQKQRLCIYEYLRLYGVVMYKIYICGDNDKTISFISDSVDAFLERYIKEKGSTLDIGALRPKAYAISLKYLLGIKEAIQDMLEAGYSSPAINAMCDWLEADCDYDILKL